MILLWAWRINQGMIPEAVRRNILSTERYLDAQLTNTGDSAYYILIKIRPAK